MIRSFFRPKTRTVLFYSDNLIRTLCKKSNTHTHTHTTKINRKKTSPYTHNCRGGHVNALKWAFLLWMKTGVGTRCTWNGRFWCGTRLFDAFYRASCKNLGDNVVRYTGHKKTQKQKIKKQNKTKLSVGET